MQRRSFLRLLVFGLMMVFAIGSARAQPADEKSRIEALITHLASLKDARFVRNGKTYDAKDAAKFLRGKWDAKAKEIQSAEQFIDKAASVSSTTGQAYVIKFDDGHEVKCGDYLKQRLKKAAH